MLERLKPLPQRLRPVGCQRDRAGNRELFFDDACALILLTCFNPTVKSLRDLKSASRLKQVKKKLGGRRRRAATSDIVLVTNLTDVPAEVIGLLYQYRWLIELFFRWLRCVFECRHLVSQGENGIQIQMYRALIAYLLINIASGGGVKPNQWTYKLLSLYLQGWATEEEVLEHLAQRAAKDAKQSS
jgi:hypothetical protein